MEQKQVVTGYINAQGFSQPLQLRKGGKLMLNAYFFLEYILWETDYKASFH